MSAVLKPDPLLMAVEALIAAKRREEAAKLERIAAEERILALHPAREEGSETIEVSGYKVSVTGKITYSCDDVRKLADACAIAGMPPERVPVKTVVELDATGCKWLRANDPAAWRVVAQHVTIKPAKTAVSVKEA